MTLDEQAAIEEEADEDQQKLPRSKKTERPPTKNFTIPCACGEHVEHRKFVAHGRSCTAQIVSWCTVFLPTQVGEVDDRKEADRPKGCRCRRIRRGPPCRACVDFAAKKTRMFAGKIGNAGKWKQPKRPTPG